MPDVFDIDQAAEQIRSSSGTNIPAVLADASDPEAVLTATLALIDAGGQDRPSADAVTLNAVGSTARDRGFKALSAAACYAEGRLRALLGELAAAEQLVLSARGDLAALGDHVGALRTSLGLAHVQLLRGRALDARATLVDMLSVLAGREGESDNALLVARAEQNLGSIDLTLGQPRRSIRHLERAADIFASRGDDHGALEVANNRALALLQLGEARAAIEVVSEVLRGDEIDDYRRAELTDTLGRAQLVAGLLGLAPVSLALAVSLFDNLDMALEASESRIALADAFLTIGLMDDAAPLYEHVLDDAVRWDSSDLSGWSALGLAQIAIHRGAGDAAAFVERSRHSFRSTGSALGMALANLTEFEIHRRTGRLDAAQQRAESAREQAAEAGLPVEQALAELALFDISADPRHLEAASASIDATSAPRLRGAYLVRQAQLHRRLGRMDEARSLLETAVDAVEYQRGTLVGERHRRHHLSTRLGPYNELVALLVESGSPNGVVEAFRIAERASARSLTDALSLHDRDDAESHRVGELSARFNTQLGDSEVTKARTAAFAKRRRLADSAVPVDADGSVKRSIDIDALHDALTGLDAVAVSYTGTLDQLGAFVISDAHIRFVDFGPQHGLDSLLRQLGAHFTRMRSGSLARRWLPRLVEDAHALLGQLHDRLIAPLELDEGRVRNVVVAPTGPLSGVPFHALQRHEGPLVGQLAVTKVPNMWTWMRCLGTAPAQGLSKIIAASTGRLPSIKAEGVDVAARIAGPRDLLLSERASRTKLLDTVRPHVLHVACHGAFRTEEPMFSTLRLSDGTVHAHELAGVDLTGSLVCLSACETGRGVAMAGDEVMGFPRALLLAGARDVVTSEWVADEEAARLLMSFFHEHVAAGTVPAEALRLAQLATRELYPHPYHWATFSIVGAGLSQHLRSAHEPSWSVDNSLEEAS